MKNRRISKRKEFAVLWHETVQYLEKLVLYGVIEVSDIPACLRINCGDSIYLYGLRAARSVSKEKEQSILELIMRDAEQTNNSLESKRLKYLYSKMAEFHLPDIEVCSDAMEKGFD